MGGSGGTYAGGHGVAPEEQDCPKKIQCNLVDVLQCGNVEIALSLPNGTMLELYPENDNSISVRYNGQRLGYLPTNRNNIARCIEEGWKYTASLVTSNEDIQNPQISILVIGSPN